MCAIFFKKIVSVGVVQASAAKCSTHSRSGHVPMFVGMFVDIGVEIGLEMCVD